jgi:ABC-type spermidine/putrescine transport system permease subunit II
VSAPTPDAVLEITLRTLGVCGAALGAALLLGLPAGIWLGRRRFRGRVLGISLVNSGMGAWSCRCCCGAAGRWVASS